MAQIHPLYKQLQNPLTQMRNEIDRERLSVAFPSLRSEPHILALRCYLDDRPEKFFDPPAYRFYLNWLQQRDKVDSEGLKKYFSNFDTEINRALLFLRDINSEEWHDRVFKNEDEYNLFRFIDKYVHPAYLRLVEAVFAPLVRPIAYFSRLDRGRGTDGLNVWSVMEELGRRPANCIISHYQHIIRNGIAHGGIMFLQNEIRYQDKSNEEKFYAKSIVQLLDDFLDVCNGLAAALKVFFLSHGRDYIFPHELLIEELQEETRTPWWSIEGYVKSEVSVKSQLILYVRPNSRHYDKIHWSTIQSGILTEFFAPGYDRYLFSFRSQKSWPGWAAFDGQKLRNLREAGVNDFSQYSGIVENNLIFYITHVKMPAFLGKLDTWIHSLRIHMPIALQQIKENLEIPYIICRNAVIHRNAWGMVLKAEVIIEDFDDNKAIDIIRKYRSRIIKSAVKYIRSKDRLSVTAYLPVGYAQVSVFRRDYRCRRLSNFGLNDDLVCTVRLHRMHRIKSPDIMGSTVETIGKWRIAWNKSWLEDSHQQFHFE